MARFAQAFVVDCIVCVLLLAYSAAAEAPTITKIYRVSMHTTQDCSTSNYEYIALTAVGRESCAQTGSDTFRYWECNSTHILGYLCSPNGCSSCNNDFTRALGVCDRGAMHECVDSASSRFDESYLPAFYEKGITSDVPISLLYLNDSSSYNCPRDNMYHAEVMTLCSPEFGTTSPFYYDTCNSTHGIRYRCSDSGCTQNCEVSQTFTINATSCDFRNGFLSSSFVCSRPALIPPASAPIASPQQEAPMASSVPTASPTQDAPIASPIQASVPATTAVPMTTSPAPTTAPVSVSIPTKPPASAPASTPTKSPASAGTPNFSISVWVLSVYASILICVTHYI